MSIDVASRTTALAYYEKIGAALFPILPGQKAPTGIIASFKHDFSRDPKQWFAWQSAHPNCNFGIVAFASNLIICDIDTSTDDSDQSDAAKERARNEAWAVWSDVCASWGLPEPLAPHVQSARLGWHCYLTVPPHIDASQLRQPDAVKKRINIRCVGFTVAAGSYYDGTAKNEQSGPYLLLTDAPPHPAPQALIDHCTRAITRGTGESKPGSLDFDDVKKMYQWMANAGLFDSYEDWLQAGMAAKAEYGDRGIELWEITHDATVDGDTETLKWDSFASEATSQSVLIPSLMKRAHAAGWRETIRKSTSSMFGTVAAIAAAAGAQLHSAQMLPMMDTQKTVAAIGQPILDNFLAGTTDVPFRPSSLDYPTLPETLAEHPLYDMLRTAIDRITAMAEGGSKTFRQDRVLPALAVLHGVHEQVADNVCQRIIALGGIISPGKLDSAVKNFEWRVRVEQNTATGFITDARGNPAAENSDNVHVFVRQRKVKLRFNTWKDQGEISDAERDDFVQLTDHIFGDLLMDAENSQFNYHPSEGRFRRGLISNARKHMYDPLLEKIDTLAREWDGVHRLDTWLSQCVGVPIDGYHRVVGRNLIGGLVRRARHPGCEQAETVIFISPTQGTGKSTLCKILALDPAWHTDSFKFEGSPQNNIPQLFGKWVIELSELAGMAHKDMEHIKNFMSATTDNFTKKYEAFATDHPRRCCFIGTSNDRRPLADATGGRRFLPVHVVGEVNTDWLRANVEQIIGEAAQKESAGESFGIPREVWEAAAGHQEAARAMSPVEELCQEWFDRPGSYFVTATDVGRALKMAGQSQYARYGGFLDKMGWRNENLIVPGTGRKCRVWVKHSTNLLTDCVRLEPSQKEIHAPVEMRLTMPRQVQHGPIMPPLPPVPY